MENIDNDDVRELLLGTWASIALIAGHMIRDGAIRRNDLVSLLSDAETAANGQRRVPLTAIRRMLAMGFSGRPHFPRCRAHRQT